MLNLAPAAPSIGPDGRRRPDDDVVGSTTARHRYTAGLREGDATMRHRLRTALARLLGEGYPPDLPVELNGAVAAPAGRFFVDVRGAAPVELLGQQYGLYGRVQAVYVNAQDGSWTIYLRGSKIKIIVAVTAVEGLDSSVSDPEVVKDGHVLALARVQESQRTPGNWYARVQRPHLITFIAAKRGSSGKAKGHDHAE